MAAERRLSELLQEQQEPFLIEAAKIRRLRRGRGGSGGGRGGACCPVAACRRLLRLCNHGFKKRRSGGGGVGGSGVNGLRSALSKVLCSKAMRRVLRWDSLGVVGCFPGGGGGVDRDFRRLRRSTGDSGECDLRAMEFCHNDDDVDDERAARWKADMDVDDSSRQLSPVSVLELHSDDEDSPVHCRWEDEKPSTSGSSPPSEDFIGATSPCFTYNVHGKICPMEVEEDEEETVRAGKSIEEQISSWEKIAEDISNIPRMVEMDFSQSIQQWSELKLEAMEIGTRIETLIFDEIRRETVCDMLASHCTLATTSC
ncbi:hypothetical protein E2562_001222 [Oryza meyeriana var. granulata]|uniref:DUF4378 domain-containing protein n=1 Tax=Oryza meyeriana var. granulata TaxID=110450 RepID=A0A6G1DC68_9ORYZ|nr:hypothetical protein E2562_001222 [Oryza meyeriana var. granulata]